MSKQENIYTMELENAFGATSPITRDMKKALKHTNVGRQELRFLVDTFYQTQDKRIAIQNQIRSIEQGADSSPEATHNILTWTLKNFQTMEDSLFKVLDSATEMRPAGKWLKQTMGIGPTLAAALLAYFEINEHTTSAGHFWSYAGYNDHNCPRIGSEKAKAIVQEAIQKHGDNGKVTDDVIASIAKTTGRKPKMLFEKGAVKDSKGEIKMFKDGPHYTADSLTKAVSIIPYNAELKTLCWKCGQQFVKLSNNPNSLYGKLFRERKTEEALLNEKGHYSETAEKILATKNIGKSTDAYKAYSQGMLPKAQIQARAERFAVKIFISHLFDCMWIEKHGTVPPAGYVFEHLHHVDYIAPEVSYSEIFPGFVDIRTYGSSNVGYSSIDYNKAEASEEK